MRKDTSKAPYEMTQFENLKNDPFGYIVVRYYSKKNLEKQREYAQNAIKQPNELSRGYYRCSTTAHRLFLVTVREYLKNIKAEKQKDRWISLELANVVFGLNISDGQKTRDLFKKSVNEVADLHVIIKDDEHEYHRLNLFEEVKYNWDWGTLKFKLSENFSNFLLEPHKMGFTIFSMEQSNKIQSFYARRYFEIAMSFYGFKGECIQISPWAIENGVEKKNSWFFAYSVEEIRALFRIAPDEYQDVRNLRKKLVELPIQELNEKIPSMSFKVEKVYDKKKLQGFIFWVSELSENKIEHKKDESQEEREETNEINKEQEEIAAYKNKYPEEFKKALDEVKAQPQLPGIPRFDISDEADAVSILKDAGLTI